MEKEQLILLKKYIDKKIDNNLTYQSLLNELASSIPDSDLKILIALKKINDNKIIVISDTHYGSKLEDYNYINLVYNYAINNNIFKILHAGDLLQGTIRPTKSANMQEQIESVLKNYPYDKYIQNYILLGNHDYIALRKDINLLSLFNQRKDLEILGFKKVYINWQNNLIALSHNLKKYKEEIPRIGTIVKFCGHRHELFIKEKDNNSKIYLPTLSNDIKYYEAPKNYPGFVECYIIDNILYVRNLIIKDNIIKPKGLVLEKKIDERLKL